VEQRIRFPFDRESGEDRGKYYRLGYVLEGGSSVWVKHFDPKHRSVELGDVIQAEIENGAALAPTQRDDCSSENLTEGALCCE